MKKTSMPYAGLPVCPFRACITVTMLISSVFSADAGDSTMAVLAEAYRKSINTVERRHILSRISAVKPDGKQENTGLITEILRDGLHDAKPTVAAEAARQAGRLTALHLTDDLIKTYKRADMQYLGYSERVKGRVIEALGGMKSLESRKFLLHVLKEEGMNMLAREALEALARCGAAEDVQSVKPYRTEVAAILTKAETQNADALVLTDIKSHLILVDDVIEQLEKR